MSKSKVAVTTVTGTLMWAHVGPEAKGKSFNGDPQWDITVVVPKSTAEKFASKGIKPLKQDKEGNYILNLKRPTTVQPMKGDPFELSPPIVSHKSGQEINPDAIGNGSTGSVVLEIREYAPNKFSSRIREVIVDNYEEYVSEEKELEEFEW